MDDVYVKYERDLNQGACAVVRPDEYIGSVVRLGKIEGVENSYSQSHAWISVCYIVGQSVAKTLKTVDTWGSIVLLFKIGPFLSIVGILQRKNNPPIPPLTPI